MQCLNAIEEVKHSIQYTANTVSKQRAYELEEVVCDLDGGGGVALDVGELRLERGLVEEARHDVARVVEHDRHVNVLRALFIYKTKNKEININIYAEENLCTREYKYEQ